LPTKEEIKVQISNDSVWSKRKILIFSASRPNEVELESFLNKTRKYGFTKIPTLAVGQVFHAKKKDYQLLLCTYKEDYYDTGKYADSFSTLKTARLIAERQKMQEVLLMLQIQIPLVQNQDFDLFKVLPLCSTDI
jgi:hypothetical protein